VTALPALRAAALATVLATGCATSRIVTNDPAARVYVDGRLLRPGQRFVATGPPHTANVLVLAKDGRRAYTRVSREFGFGTLFRGLYTMGACWLVCWRYPHEVTVLLPPPSPVSSWDAAPLADPWALPPPGWRESGTRAATPPPAPAADPWATPPSAR
jgi:hypothetical protein